MKTIHAFFYLFLLIPILFSFIDIYYYKAKEKSVKTQQTAIFYKIENQNNEFVGYLLGTMHVGLQEKNAEKIIPVLKPYLDQVSKVHLEATVPISMTHASCGVEKSLQPYFDENPHKKGEDLEDFSAQLQMLGCMQNLYGTLYMPMWAKFSFTQPSFSNILRVWNTIALNPVKLITNDFFKSSFDKFNFKTQENFSKLQISYPSGLCTTDPSSSVRVLIPYRDQLMVKKIQQSKIFSPQNPALIAVGVSHLSTIGGIKDQLINAGYSLTPESINFND